MLRSAVSVSFIVLSSIFLFAIGLGLIESEGTVFKIAGLVVISCIVIGTPLLVLKRS